MKSRTLTVEYRQNFNEGLNQRFPSHPSSPKTFSQYIPTPKPARGDINVTKENAAEKVPNSAGVNDLARKTCVKKAKPAPANDPQVNKKKYFLINFRAPL